MLIFVIALLASCLASRFACTIALPSGLKTNETLLPRCLLSRDVLRYMGILLLCWLPYLVIRFPGNWDPDTASQILQGYGFTTASDHHPWFDTLVFTAFWKLGAALGSHAWSLLAYAIAQNVLTAFFFAAATRYLKALGCDKRVVGACLLFWAVYPVVPLFAQTMNKDSFHGPFWIGFVLHYVEIVRTRGMALKKPGFVIPTLLVFLGFALTKQTGVYVLVLCGVVCVLWCKSARLISVAPFVVTTLTYLVVWQGMLLPAWGVKKTETAEALSIPIVSQMLV